MAKPIDGNTSTGFYPIPGFSDYVIDKNGRVVNNRTGVELDGCKNPAGYHNYRLKSDNGHTVTLGKHRLLGVVFIPETRDTAGLVINHKNGNVDNNEIKNLEWVTQLENIHHAGLMGLTKKCIPFEVLDVLTEEVTRYSSAIEYARNINVTKDWILYRLKFGPSRLFPEMKRYRKISDKSEWPKSTNIADEILKNGTKKKVLLRKLPDKEFLFDSLTELSDEIGVCMSLLSKWINSEGQKVYQGYIQLKWADDLTPWREVKDPCAELDATLGKIPVKAFGLDSRKELFFDTSAQCAKFFRMATSTFSYKLNKSKHGFVHDGFLISFKHCPLS